MPAVSHLLAARSAKPVVDTPLSQASFTLDSSGLAGFFGGDSAVSGMATVHLFPFRRWGGWYNSPGSYEIAKQYGQLANSRFWDALFPGSKQDPAQLFGLDGKPGPAFLAARSGSNIPHTSHAAYLVAHRALALPALPVGGRRTTPASVTVIDLPPALAAPVQPAPRLHSRTGFLAAVPTAASAAACVLCALAGDWWCFASIALGMLAGGVACLIIGGGALTFTHPTPARGAPPGDGLLVTDEGVIVLRGEEAAVACVTRGRFVLEYAGQPAYSQIGHCSVLLTLQFLVQLLLIPQSTLFGQLMFVASLGVSWAYNTYLSSLDLEELQTDVLLDVLRLNNDDAVQAFTLGSRTAMVVFACLALQPGDPLRNPHRLLTELIPNDTEVWHRWRTLVAEKLLRRQSLTFREADWELPGLSHEQQDLLKELLMDAQAAYEGFTEFTNPLESRSQRSSLRKPIRP